MPLEWSGFSDRLRVHSAPAAPAPALAGGLSTAVERFIAQPDASPPGEVPRLVFGASAPHSCRRQTQRAARDGLPPRRDRVHFRKHIIPTGFYGELFFARGRRNDSLMVATSLFRKPFSSKQESDAMTGGQSENWQSRPAAGAGPDVAAIVVTSERR